MLLYIIIYLIRASNEVFFIKQYLQQLFSFYPVYLVSLLNHVNCVVTLVTCYAGCVSTWVELLRGLRRLRESKYFLRELTGFFYSFIQSLFIQFSINLIKTWLVLYFFLYAAIYSDRNEFINGLNFSRRNFS